MEFDKTNINIEKYIQSELSGEALKAFEAQIEKDEALQKKVSFYQYSDVVLRDNLSQKKDTTDADSEFVASLDKLGDKYFPSKAKNEFTPTAKVAYEETTSKPFVIKRLLPFATLAAVAALLLFLFIPNNDNELYENYFELAKPINTQGPTGNLTDFDQALGKYESKNYQEAIRLFNKSIDENPGNPWALVFKGCSEMELNQIDEGITTFKNLSNSDNDFREMANWYLALCQLKKEDIAQTKTMLKRISPEDKKYYDKAQQLLKEL